MVKSHHLTLAEGGISDVNTLKNLCPEPYLPVLNRCLKQLDDLDPFEKPFGCDLQSVALGQFAIACAVNQDPVLLFAALLSPIWNFVPKHFDGVLACLPEEWQLSVHRLIQGTARMQALDQLAMQGKRRPEHAGRMRKMLLAMVDDVRVIFLKLIERLFVMQHLKSMPKTDHQSIAEGVMQFYAPLANRLGIWQLKWPLEDLAFRYLQFEAYQALAKALEVSRRDRETHVEQLYQILSSCIDKVGISDATLSGRAKHLYSIHKKMTRKDEPLSAIHDVIAMRILVNEMEECYSVLSEVHSRWQPLTESFDDYIAVPKQNGYQSLHTAVMVPDIGVVEVQIRTQAMHDQAELGVASHWQYKEGEGDSGGMISKLALLRELMSWQQELSQTSEQMSAAYQTIFADRIYPFTPQYDVYDLPSGSTALDLAYHIHTQIGHGCRGAKINDKMVPITTPLQTGDVVEIIRQKHAKPSRDWLRRDMRYIVTPRARSKIAQWFRAERLEENIQGGKQLLQKELRRSEITQAQWQRFYPQLGYKKKDLFYADLGRGDISVGGVISQARRCLVGGGQRRPIDVDAERAVLSHGHPEQRKLKIDGGSDLLSYRAACCLPVPGDAVKGLLTQSRGISVHRADCVNMQYLIRRYPEKIIDVSWALSGSESL